MSNQAKRDEEKKLRRQKRMEEIIQSAEIVFEEKGIHDSKMIDIAKKSELSKGSLYFYFKSKDELVWELLQKHSKVEFERGYEYVNSLKGSGYSRLEAYIRLFNENLLQSYTAKNLSYQYREYLMQMISTGNLTDEMKTQFKNMFIRNLSTFTELIEQGQNDGSIKQGIDPDLVGRGFGSAFGTHFRYLVGLKASFDNDFVVERSNEFIAFNMMILESLKGE